MASKRKPTAKAAPARKKRAPKLKTADIAAPMIAKRNAPWAQCVELADGVTLYQGDCREILPHLDPVDHVITDPPYEVEAHAGGRRLKSMRGTKRRAVRVDALAFAPITDDLRRDLSKAARRLSRGWFLAFCQVEAVAEWREAMEGAGCAWRRAMVWVKPDGSPQLSGDRPAQGYECIAASWCGDGGSRWNGGGKRGVFIVSKHDQGFGRSGPANLHPTQKPVVLMTHLVELFSDRGESVLDPMMGAGSTGVAAVRAGRRFIGIEQDRAHFATACRRIEATLDEPSFFNVEPRFAAAQLGLF